MKTFGIAFLSAALLVGAVLAQDNDEASGSPLCVDGCSVFCETIGSLCVDIPPLVNCASIKATCNGVCGLTCDCNTKCLAGCQSMSAECEAKDENGLSQIVCKGKEAACTSACPATCAGQVITQGIKQALGQVFASMTKPAVTKAP
ncbi:uncharacterized protein LOC101856917 [Aplysia californica]|uniref:Uncharacterized protein LOC101856917 n=1 Tax=Aplysia californica TaxID=6500 RepID=A0ABM0K1C8_APLCA|nr:uncharacterized protein LOC101856917 [Aplysia californica]